MIHREKKKVNRISDTKSRIKILYKTLRHEVLKVLYLKNHFKTISFFFQKKMWSTVKSRMVPLKIFDQDILREEIHVSYETLTVVCSAEVI